MLPPPLPAVAATTLLPGLWEYTASFAGAAGKTEQKCLAKAEVDRMLTDPASRRYACDYAVRTVGGGRVRLRGVCTSRKHPGQTFGVSLRGTYTPRTIDLKGVARARVLGGLELPVRAVVTARLVSACTPAPAAAEGAAPSPPGG